MNRQRTSEALPRWTVHHADALDALRAMDTASVDAIVTDPPAGIAFMNAEWDKDKGGRDAWIAWLRDIFTEARRVAKPGAHALVWALPRTSHWTAFGLENAGWTLHDRIAHLFATGFPKSKNLDGDWDGWGTALKPAVEDWYLGRAPLSEGTVAANVEAHGCGALNVDGCRIGTGHDRENGGLSGMDESANTAIGGGWNGGRLDRPTGGRWPAHLVLSHSSYEWLGLRADTPNEVRDAIHSYYGVDEALLALRSGDSRDAVRARETEVLHAGVRWRRSPGEAQNGLGDTLVRDMPCAVSSNAGVDEERSSEILLEALSQPSQQEQPGPSWPSTHGCVSREDEGFRDREVPSREVLSMEGREVHGSSGVRARDDRDAAKGCAEARTENGAREELHSGAPSRSSGKGGSRAGRGRSRPSRERNQERQPAGEPLCGQAERSLNRAPNTGKGAVPPPRGSHPVAHGECRLEVRSDVLPDGWLRYFEVVGHEGCVPLGTAKVKAAPAWNDNRPPSTFTGAKTSEVHHADDDGTETIERWDCAEGCAVAMLDAEGAAWKGQTRNVESFSGDYEAGMFGVGNGATGKLYGDSGGASRFFFCAKPSTTEREMGLDGFAFQTVDDGRETTNDTAYQRGATKRRNVHPTVKSVALMRWLTRLITPPGGLVLDLFTGSGTTGIAAMCEGFRFVGVEAEAEFAAIARARIGFAAANPRAFEAECVKAGKVDARQLDMFGRTGT